MDDNLQKWKRFLSSLPNSRRQRPPVKQNDFLLCSIDCLSTNLSKQLLERSGEEIQTTISKDTLKKINIGRDSASQSKAKKSSRRPKKLDISRKHDKSNAKSIGRNAPTSTISCSDSERTESSDSESQSEQEKSSRRRKDLDKSRKHDKSNAKSIGRNAPTSTISSSDSESTEESDSESQSEQEKSSRRPKDKERGVGSSKITCIKRSANDESLDHLPPGKKNRISLRSEEIRLVEENIETTRTRKRNINSNKRKNDVDISSSKWTVEMLSNYVNFEKSVNKIELKPSRFSKEHVNKIVFEVLRQIQDVERVMFTSGTSCTDNTQSKIESGDIYDLSGIQRTETDIRIRLDAILFPIAKEMGLSIETGKSFGNKNLPSCEFDYRLHYKRNMIGVVEAKSRLYGDGLEAKSVVQGILQLCALQAEVYGRMAKTRLSNKRSHLPFFNIISDGYKVIFMQLNHDKLLFDHKPGRNHVESTLRYHEMNSEVNIKGIVEKLVNILMQSMTASQGGGKEDDSKDDEDDGNM